MSDVGLQLGHGRRHRPRRSAGCLAVLLALAVLAGGGYYAYSVGGQALKEHFAPPADYAGPGGDPVLVRVREGDSSSDIAQTLRDHDVVKSTEAFTEAAQGEPLSRGIQVGFYRLRTEMPAQDALDVLIDPDNLLQNTVALPEGMTVDEIVQRLAKRTDFTAKQYRRVLNKPRRLGLPGYAHGKAEGYLFPATYQLAPGARPRAILRRFVDRFEQAAGSMDLTSRADALGVSPHDVVTIASLVQAEARNEKDFDKVSRVIYNRLKKHMPLQLDSTVHYAVGKKGSVSTTKKDRRSDSPYNTYRHKGLPPTPIQAPGKKALEAALEPAKGSWLYFVTTNPETGETKFATTYAEHQKNVKKFKRFCARSEAC